MKTIIFTFIVFLSFNALSATGLNSKNFINKKFTSSELADSLQKKDVWAKNYGKNNAGFAALFATFIPGGGQLYNGQYLKAGLFIGGEALLFIAAKSAINENDKERWVNLSGVGFGITLGLLISLRIWEVVDAITSAKEINEAAQNKKLSLIYFPKNGSQNIGFSLHF